MDDLLPGLPAALGDRYELLRLIGEGGMARVYLTRDRRHAREVALKVMRPEVAAGLGAERFLREIRIVAALQHPNIVPLFDSGAGQRGGEAELLWYVMPYLPGGSLRGRLERERCLPLPDVIRIARDVAGALDHAHARGVVHRDVKPENILLGEGHAFVADFGVARALDQAGPHGATATGLAMGTPAYMSPEQAAGEAELDGRSDVYSLACVIYEMLAGRPPFAGATPREIMAKHATGTAASIRDYRAELGPAVEAALALGLAKTAADRTRTATDLVELLDDRGMQTIRTPVPPPRTRRGRRVAALAGAGLFIAGLVAGGLVWRTRGAPDGPAVGVSPSAVAVLPFTVRGGDTLGLGEGLVGLLGTKLDGAGDLHSVDGRALLSYIAREGRQDLGPEQGKAIAEHFGAGLFVLGDVLTVGPRLRLTAALYEARRGGRAAATASVEGPTERVFELVDSLAGRLVASWSGRESRLTGIAAVTTSSLPALKAYLDGESAFRAGNFDAAVAAFQRAVVADSLFALAWYRMSVAAEWLTRADITREAAEHAVRLGDRLSEHDRMLLEALVATRRGAALEAERLYQNVLAVYPEDVEAWVQLGEAQFHYGPLLGTPIAQAEPTWNRVLELEPQFFAPIVHLARIAASERRATAVDSLVRRALALREAANVREAGSRSELLELETLRAFGIGDTAEEARVRVRLESATDVTVHLAMWGVASFVGDPDAAARVARVLTEPARPPWSRSSGYLALANLAAAGGRIEAARAALDTAATFDPRAAAEFRALLAAAPFREASAQEIARARDALVRAPEGPEAPAETSVFLSVHHRLHRQLRTYLLGLLAARSGDAVDAAQSATALERMPLDVDAGSLLPDLARGIRAELAARRGRPAAEVTAALAGVRRESWYELATASPFFAQVRERFLQAEALVAQGRDDEAAPLYRSLSGQGSMFELPYLAPAQLRLGEIAERRGRSAEAADHYARVIELWRNADHALQPLVQEARARLARVRAEK